MDVCCRGDNAQLACTRCKNFQLTRKNYGCVCLHGAAPLRARMIAVAQLLRKRWHDRRAGNPAIFAHNKRLQYSVHVWNSDENFPVRQQRRTYLAMDGGDGMPSVRFNARQRECVQAMQKRTKSNPKGNPTTGADLGGAA